MFEAYLVRRASAVEGRHVGPLEALEPFLFGGGAVAETGNVALFGAVYGSSEGPNEQRRGPPRAGLCLIAGDHSRLRPAPT